MGNTGNTETQKRMPHIQIPENLGIAYAVLPGDPARAERASKYLENVEFLAFNREYKSYRGTWHGIPVLVMSTGIKESRSESDDSDRKLWSTSAGGKSRRSGACGGHGAR